ncbi:MAG: hypothetical protein QW666_02655 [Candidatus Woesearchaeota archaeon]
MDVILQIYDKYATPQRRAIELENLIEIFELSPKLSPVVEALLAGEQAVADGRFREAINIFLKGVQVKLIKHKYQNHKFLTDQKYLKSSYKHAIEGAYNTGKLSKDEFADLMLSLYHR